MFTLAEPPTLRRSAPVCFWRMVSGCVLPACNRSSSRATSADVFFLVVGELRSGVRSLVGGDERGNLAVRPLVEVGRRVRVRHEAARQQDRHCGGGHPPVATSGKAGYDTTLG
jgi:hypothetical protein